jgi:hypothetical protein
VKLINTDGMSFIGPGSEWFWTALSGLVLAVTFLGIYRQLSIARNANAFEQRNRIMEEFNSERMVRNKIEILLALREGVNPEHVPEGAASSVGNFLEGVAALVRARHVDRGLVYESLGNTCRWWWAAFAPYARRARIEDDDPSVYEHFEWLAGVMTEMARKAGVGPSYDEAFLASTLDRQIQTYRQQIRVAEELRAVIVRPMSPPVPPASPPSTQAEPAPVGPLA